jgi:methionyl aminopeptidase
MALKPVTDNTIHLRSPREVEIMREAGRVVALTVLELKRAAEPGMTTADLDRVAARMFKQHGATSTALGYFGFPGHICVSVNEEVVHGIPGGRRLK